VQHFYQNYLSMQFFFLLLGVPLASADVRELSSVWTGVGIG